MNVSLVARRLAVRTGGMATKAIAGRSLPTVQCLSTKPHKYSLETREDFDWDDYDHRSVATKVVISSLDQQHEQQDIDDYDHRPKQERPVIVPQQATEEEEPVSTIEEALMEGHSMYHRAMRFNLDTSPATPGGANQATSATAAAPAEEVGDIDDYDHRSLTMHPQLKLQKKSPPPSPSVQEVEEWMDDIDDYDHRIQYYSTPKSASEVEAWMDDIDDYDHRIHYYCYQQRHNCPKKTKSLFNPMMKDVDDYDHRLKQLSKQQDEYIRQHAWE